VLPVADRGVSRSAPTLMKSIAWRYAPIGNRISLDANWFGG
jgi:hypothetical protein